MTDNTPRKFTCLKEHSSMRVWNIGDIRVMSMAYWKVMFHQDYWQLVNQYNEFMEVTVLKDVKPTL